VSYCIGFDIGGTKCAVSLGEITDGNIRVVHRQETPTLNTPIDTLSVLAPFVKEWTKAYCVTKAGISCGGPLDSQKGLIVSTPNLPSGWHGFYIVEYVQKEFGLSAKLQNDANACAVAEWKFGAGRATKNMVFFTFGTGLGAGLILDGKLYAGTNDNAGEAGHIRLAKKGPVGFGGAGSFEGFCSGAGITRLAKIMAARCKKMPECIEKMGGMDEITTKKLAQAAFAGASCAVDLIYHPAESEFLRLARQQGLQTVNGESMLFYQAYYADCIYTKRKSNPCEAQALYEKYKKRTKGEHV
jgi:glucokinase